MTSLSFAPKDTPGEKPKPLRPPMYLIEVRDQRSVYQG